MKMNNIGKFMKKILVCDDDPVTLNVVYRKLTGENLGEIITAGDGRQGIELATKNDFSLIITDLQMPYKTGLDLAAFLRSEQKKDTPIIVLSSEGLEHVVMEAFEIGVNDFINKPFSAGELIAKVRKFLL
jgi:DNA-binding response OmpR family regulator